MILLTFILNPPFFFLMRIAFCLFNHDPYSFQTIIEIFQVVIMGASNVGKSSFLNALFKNKLAFTSKRPGHTKALNFFEGQSRLRLIDVPGYGFGSTTNQMELLGEYITARGSNSAACLLIDARKGIKELDLVAFSLLLDHKLPFQVLYQTCSQTCFIVSFVHWTMCCLQSKTGNYMTARIWWKEEGNAVV